MKLLKIPETAYLDEYDEARFKLTWRICFFMAMVLPLLGLSLMVNQQFVFIPTMIAWGIVLFFLITLYRTRSYKLVAMVFTPIGVALCCFTLIGFPEEYHFVDAMWMMVITLYAFFTLGNIWGLITLGLNTAAIVYFVLFSLNYSLKLVGNLEEGKTIALAINFIICSSIIAYLIVQFTKTIDFTEKSLKSVNAKLNVKNQEVESQNAEKTVMLKEIHHRVKNNLQVITSLLRLQSQEIQDPRSVESFNEAIQRVISMSLIHEKMYQSGDLAKIDLQSYLEDLTNDLINSYSVKIPIKIEIDCSIEHVQPKALVSYALIFNELISNSLKHGFKNANEGQIAISIKNSNHSRMEWVYGDNGNWIEPIQENTFGTQLIQDLTEQLDGTFSLNKLEGTTYHFSFPNLQE